MWFVESAAGKIGRISPEGRIAEYVVGDAGDEPTAIITGPDNALWFTEVGTGRLGRMNASGHISHFAAGHGRLTGDITTDFSGSLWFGKKSSVARMSTGGKLTEYSLPSGIVDTGAIFGSKSGGVYMGAIKSDGTGAIVGVSETGATKEYDLPQKNRFPIEMALDPDGWFFMTVTTPDGKPVPVVYSLK